MILFNLRLLRICVCNYHDSSLRQIPIGIVPLVEPFIHYCNLLIIDDIFIVTYVNKYLRMEYTFVNLVIDPMSHIRVIYYCIYR